MSSKHNDAWRRNLAGESVGEYALIDFVGAGRIGYVYKAQRHDLPDVFWAVKLIFSNLKPGWEEELRKVAKLCLVEGVVHFHYLGAGKIKHEEKTELCQFTVWDYIGPGRSLKRYLFEEKNISAGFVFAVIEQILRVLHACEAQGVARHGDLHAGNILIGDKSEARLDDALVPRAPVYVSDFGYGTSGGITPPKDDYTGLAGIINEMVERVDYSRATATHRQMLHSMRRDLGKLLNEGSPTEKRKPMELLRLLREMQQGAQGTAVPPDSQASTGDAVGQEKESLSVGQFQVSEMIGEKWNWWQRLFVPTVPARSKILRLDIPTVVTGPRGCGKTMLLRRLSERLILECGDIPELAVKDSFMALYVNANDIADAFSRFPEKANERDEARLVCYANLCILADLLAVQSARAGRIGELASDSLLEMVQTWLVPEAYNLLVLGEDRLEGYRALLEQIKWSFPHPRVADVFPGYGELSQYRWLPRFFHQIRSACPWIGSRSMLLFIDDFSTPRVSESMQRVLNRLFLQRSNEFLAKVATEAWTTFVGEDSAGKQLQDGDDYQLVDMGEESLFLSNDERLAFLSEVFGRRLKLDARIPETGASLGAVLGRLDLSKTEFARRLRSSLQEQSEKERVAVAGESQRRGASRPRVLYHGENVFSDLWSGDTRTMIQLISDVIDRAFESNAADTRMEGHLPVRALLQDEVFRHRGGEWLNSHTRNEPTNLKAVQSALEDMRRAGVEYSFAGGTYGDHLKAIVEAFVFAATRLLLGPTYVIREGGKPREVPRMAFRVEIIDEFRVNELANEIYRDLIRYGLFMRDSRGKSVRGAFVPRLYLRRLLLPYCTLALSKRDSVSLTCKEFVKLLLEPDKFKESFVARLPDEAQMGMFEHIRATEPEPAYDDLGSSMRYGEDNEH